MTTSAEMEIVVFPRLNCQLLALCSSCLSHVGHGDEGSSFENPAFLRGRSCNVLLSLLSPQRFLSTTFKASDLQIDLTKDPKPKPDPGNLVFGKTFTDHMLTVEWSKEKGWGKPHIKPFQNLSLHPASSALHYSVQLFEGMKAFRGPDNCIRLFRPMMNMDRMLRSALRCCLPSFNKSELLECIRQLIHLEQDWVPHSDTASLYIRPTFIGTESSLGVATSNNALLYVILGPVGPYFTTGSFNPVSLLADPRFVRAWMGGVGDSKLGGNYGPTIYVQNEATKEGCQQVLWLYGDNHQITEVGTMNIFVFWKDQQGDLELVTPPLNGIILPGVTRQSLLDLAQKWNYHIPTMENGPEIAKRFLKELTDIQYGRVASNWVLQV
ncbi:hypothetical protein JD844_001548 [Phrynosoma platyrhinos]|uniref:Branched-chain-amino-acid aminotransferase n=1 Tax=Phrynosoma platyrhinos TaxID=52577 RepID=A0ABQ7TA78_PHRPL|nr:hypothetical protein JD844_001548 [Phrynosoma platyrhinos]